jgi:predicted acyl esterase
MGGLGTALRRRRPGCRWRSRLGEFAAPGARRRTLSILVTGCCAAAGLVVGGTFTRRSQHLDPTCPREGAGLTIRGSVAQIDVAHASPGAAVTVRGQGTRISATTDALGGLLVRHLSPGRFTVTVAGDSTSPHVVRVIGPDETPSPDFYRRDRIDIHHLGEHPVDGYLTTRDCTRLSYVVELPHRRPRNGRYDVVVSYSGYSPGVRGPSREFRFERSAFRHFTAAGYAVVGVNMRGTGCSDGAFDLMERLTWLDGYDVVETLSAQPWVHRVALANKSWPGLSQLFVASTRPPHLAAIMPGAPVVDFYRDVMFPGGSENRGFGLDWATGRDRDNRFPPGNLNVATVTSGTHPQDPACRAHLGLRGQNVSVAAALQRHPTDDGYWRLRTAPVRRIVTPTLLTVSWQDDQVGSRSAEAIADFPRRTDVRLIGTNGDHDEYFKGRAWALEKEFLCVHLRADCPRATVTAWRRREPITLLIETDGRGRPRAVVRQTRSEFEQPHRTAFTLGGTLRPDPARGGTEASGFHYAPMPVYWLQRPSGLVRFTSRVLRHDVLAEGTGAADLALVVPRSLPPFTLQATVTEVRPDGQEMLVKSGWSRVDPSPTVDGTASPGFAGRPGGWSATAVRRVDTQIELPPFVHVFRAGSRIRLTVSGPGGGTDDFAWHFPIPARGFPVTVAGGRGHGSRFLLHTTTPPAGAHLPRRLASCRDTQLQPCRQLFAADAHEDAPDARVGDGRCATTSGDCTLEAAVQEANALPGGATIELRPGTYELPAGAVLPITDDTLVVGDRTTIESDQGGAVFDAQPGALLVERGLTFAR